MDLAGGFNVLIQAGNGRELLEQIGGGPLQPDICIVDVNMPLMNGFETTKALKQRYPFIKVLAVTSHEDDQSILRMYKSGVNGYLWKTASLDMIKEALLEVYDHQYYFPKEVLARFPQMAHGKVEAYTKQMLSDKEVEFLRLCCSDLSYEQIASYMCLSSRTVEKYPQRIGEKLGVHGRLALAMYALWSGIGMFRSQQNGIAVVNAGRRYNY